MAESRAQFESELKKRLSLKSPHEEQTLLKSFQYYDLKQSNVVNQQQFEAVLEKVGITLPKDQITSLFKYYQQNGQLNYKSFIQRVYQSPESAVFYFQKKMWENGLDLFFDWLEQLHSKEYNFAQFKYLFYQYPEEKVRALFQYFNQNNVVRIEEVVEAFRGVVKPSGFKVDSFNIDQIIDMFKGDKTKIRKYLQSFMKFKNIKFLTQGQFDEFNHILELGNIKAQWLGERSTIYTPIRKLDFNELDLTELRTALVKKGPKAFINLKKLLLQADDDQDGYLTEKQVQKVLRDYRFPQQIGGVNIQDFFIELLGAFDQPNLVKQIFEQMDIDMDGIIPYQLLKQCYQARNHPDVKKQIKSETEQLAEFLDSYDAHHKMGSKSVTFAEFYEYCHILYACQPDQFENNLINVFTYVRPPQQQTTSVAQYAPFGTSAEKTDYSTALRPLSSQQGQRQQNINPAGLTYAQQQLQKIDNVLEKLKSKGYRGIIYMLRNITRYDAQGVYGGFNSIRIQVNQQYIKQILNQKNEISMAAFLEKILGEFQNWRLNLVQMAYRKLQSTNFQDMKKNFLARPRQKMSDDEVLIDFLDTFDSHHQLFNSNNVSQQEFEQYYHIMSFCVTDDREFEVAVKSGWMV
ncbi:unnamed protein product (macronuclear) [Paramecium tetraurelia]|uniref:EF-hand domain-containing protein n=1 Tax=Paramecium tetraurelia TaxID=5888 RepID=A0E0K9_PARTE|nr:uncharacterized protein GSPATT00021994001 [Paramecium tetraurelia]CAK88826.1 unnamed protein product [Paramecium tetraurelia]|eukprot:XP_001456223.1 hypothetical protein (macronuclear) [Paramecium tetraurelia strain d4-2]